MFEQVEELVSEHAELETQMSDPAIHGDQAKARTIGRRYAELGPIVAKYADWRRAGDDLAAAKELADEDASFRAVTFEQVVETYAEQMAALREGGVDMLLIETIFDSLNSKAAIVAAQEAAPELPLWLSFTAVDRSGRNLSGQTVEAWWVSVEHARPLVVSVNVFGEPATKVVTVSPVIMAGALTTSWTATVVLPAKLLSVSCSG